MNSYIYGRFQWVACHECELGGNSLALCEIGQKVTTEKAIISSAAVGTACLWRNTGMKYTINEIPPSNNKFIGRTNKWEYQEKKKYWAKLILLKCRPKPENRLKRPLLPLHIFLEIKYGGIPTTTAGSLYWTDL